MNDSEFEASGDGMYGDETTIQSEVLQELFVGYPTPLLNFAAACCILFMIIGIPGNLITVIALYRYKKVRNATAVFIMNLSLSDLMFCCFNMPLAASLFWSRSWRHGDLLCRLFPLMRYGLLAVSLFCILAITINRYVMIGHPRLYPKIYRKKYLVGMVALTWLCGFGALAATWFGSWGQFGLDVDIGSCSILPDEHGHSPKQFFFVIAFVIPCIFIMVCYVRIYYIVRKTALKSRMAPRNNTVAMTNNSTSTQKEDTKSHQIKGQFNSPEDSALGTLSTAATITDKSSLTAEKFQYINEGTSCLLDEASLNQNESSGIDKSPLNQKKSYSEDVRFALDVKNGHINNNGADFKENGSIKVRSNPNLLSLPDANGGKCKNHSASNPSRSFSEENIDAVPAHGYQLSAKDLKKSNKKLALQLDKAYSADPLSDCDVKTSVGCGEPHKKRRCSSLAIVNVGHIFRRQSNLKVSQKFASSSLHTNAHQPGKLTAKDKKILKMIVVIFLSFLMCYLPITISKAYQIESNVFSIIVYLFIYLTPCINPLIYVVMSSEYRQAYKNLLMCRAYGSEGSGRST